MVKFVSLEDFSTLTCISKQWLEKQAKAGKLPCIRDRNCLRFPLPKAAEAIEMIANENITTKSNGNAKGEVTNG